MSPNSSARPLALATRGALALLLVLASLLAALAPRPVPVSAATVVYITPGGAGARNGASWANAKDLQAALTDATSGSELWVKAGTYKPTTTTSDRYATFQLKNGVAIYGGFAGTESRLSQRNWTANVVVLSGDVDGDDSQAPIITNLSTVTGNGTNSYHVVTGSGTDATAVLDGVTITAGNGNGSVCPTEACGGGVYNGSGSPTLTNVTIRGNSTSSLGGGMYNFSGSPTLTNVTISGNSALDGGGMSSRSGSPTLTNVTISGNSASQSGGGMANDDSSPILTNMTISGNNGEYGGGIYDYNSSPTLTKVTISGNSASQSAGGMYNIAGGSPTLTDVTISGNSTRGQGGGMVNYYSSSPMLTNVTISGNSASGGGGMFSYASSPTLTNVTISGNSASGGGGMSNDGSGPTLTNVTISGNTASDAGGGMYNYNGSSPSIRNSILWGNTAPTAATIYNDFNSTPAIRSSLVQGSGGSGAGWVAALGTDGGGNLDADPQFVLPITAAAPTTSGNLRLLATSPAIDAGSNSVSNPSLPPTDRDGKPRVIGSSVDMGAYEALPVVASIALVGTSPTNAASVQFTVTFSTRVSGVGASDFALTTSGPSGASVTSAVAQGGPAPAKVWTVTVNTGSGDGTLRLDVVDDDGITAAALPSGSIPLGGTGPGNGGFTAGPRYSLDKTVPDTTLTSTPPTASNGTNARFGFSGSDAGGGAVTFECSLGEATFAACTSPKSYTGLTQGSHTFQVRAKDVAGNVDTTPASFTWVVDTTAPDTSITAQPDDPTNDTSASFGFTGTDPVSGGVSSGVATYECRLDSGGFASCTSPKSYTSLAEGSHTFEVRAKDAAGNVDSTPASHIWLIDVTAPQLSLPADFTVVSGYGASGAVVSYTATASDDGSGAGPVSCSPASATLFPVGTTLVSCSVADAAGNTASGGFRVTVEPPPIMRVLLPLVLR